MLDLPYSEDSRAQVDLNCVMNEQGEIIELQGTGEGRPFTVAEQQDAGIAVRQGLPGADGISRRISWGRYCDEIRIGFS